MEKQPQKQQSNSKTNTQNEDAVKKEALGISFVGDRSKRDEWSEGAVSCLLDAYESKWQLRNRAKLKGQDWEDVARHVSSRAQSTKSPKTQTQCKNKIESMKKRYRTEAAAGDPSSWPLFRRLDLLLRCGAPAPAPVQPMPHNLAVVSGAQQQQEMALVMNGGEGSERKETNLQQPQPQPQLPKQQLQEDMVGGKLKDAAEKAPVETDSSTPICNNNNSHEATNMKRKRMRRGDEGEEVVESVRWLAEVVMRSEQAMLETMREMERMRAEVERRKEEIDLKRTEIIANTQLEIARLLVGKSSDSNLDSSLRIGKKNP